MSEAIIDTNVAVIANRQNLDVAENCIEACILFLVKATAEHVVLIDSGDEIRFEYAKALRTSRPYGLGALFLRHIFDHQYSGGHVRRVDLRKDGDGNFIDFPRVPELAKFDRDDRKFAALGRKSGVAVTNAADSDWVNYLTALNANGIAVNFLCEVDQQKKMLK